MLREYFITKLRMFSSVILAILVVSGCVVGDDLPCAARAGDNGQGYICVCNSTYCDTAESPNKLKHGFYHLYKTSNSTPGFTRTTGGFIRSIVPRWNSTEEVVFVVNASTRYQEIIGIGASVTDSACLNIKTLPVEAQEKLIESYFGPSGIEYSMLRVPIGGTDFSTRGYTLDDVPFDENLEHFSLADEDFNLRLPFIKKAIALSQRDIKILACTWTAPTWMKDTNQKRPDYILQRYKEVWARYHLKFLEAYDKEGLKVWSLSGGNEGLLVVLLKLMLDTTPIINSTLTYAPIEASWLKNNLKPLLIASNYSDVKFLTLEDQRMFAPYWMDRIANDPKAYAAVDGLALHWYADPYIPANVLDEMHNKYPDKLIVYTESSINGGYGPEAVKLGSWYRGSGYLHNIFENVNAWTNAYLDWNMALDLDGGPSLSFGIDAPIIINQTSGEFYKQPIFYAMGHVSKFIPPGAVRVQVVSNQDNKTVNDRELGSGRSGKDELREYLASAKRRLLKEDVIHYVTVPQEVRCLATSNPDDSFTVMVLNTKNVTVKVTVEDSRVGHVSLLIEENSINTFVYWP